MSTWLFEQVDIAAKAVYEECFEPQVTGTATFGADGSIATSGPTPLTWETESEDRKEVIRRMVATALLAVGWPGTKNPQGPA